MTGQENGLLNWLGKNREWLLSGLLLIVLSWLGKWLLGIAKFIRELKNNVDIL